MIFALLCCSGGLKTYCVCFRTMSTCERLICLQLLMGCLPYLRSMLPFSLIITQYLVNNHSVRPFTRSCTLAATDSGNAVDCRGAVDGTPPPTPPPSRPHTCLRTCRLQTPVSTSSDATWPARSGTTPANNDVDEYSRRHCGP